MLSLAVAWICGLLIAKWQLPFGKSIFILIYFILISILILKLKKEPSWLNSYVHEKRYPQMTVFFLCIPLLFFIGYERMEYTQSKILQEKEVWSSIEREGETYVLVEGIIKEKYNEEDGIRIVLQQCLVKGYEGEKAGGCQITFEEEGTSIIPEAVIGNKVKVYGKVFVYQKATNEGQFDAFEYYSPKGIYASVKVLRLEILDEHVSLIGQNMFLLKQKMRESLLSLYPKEKAGVLSAMLLGDKDLLEEEIKELYQKNGISHILAISGLHISMLCMGLFRLLRSIGSSVKLSTSITILFLSFYICYTGGSTSSLRAGIMCIVLLGAKLVRRNYDLLSALALASILVTAIRPTEITSAGFLLSFGAVIGVAIAKEIEAQIIQKREEISSDLEKTGDKEVVEDSCFPFPKLKQCWKKRKKSSSIWWSPLLFSGMIQVITIPISLWFYYELSPYSILLNVIILPLVAFILGGGIVSVLLGLVVPSLAKLSVGGTYFLLSFYEWIGGQAQKLPYSFVLVGRPSILQVVLYYGMFLFVVWNVFFVKRGKEEFAKNFPWNVKTEELISKQCYVKKYFGNVSQQKNGVKKFFRNIDEMKYSKYVKAIFLCIGMIGGGSILFFPKAYETELVFLDVSQGDSLFLQTETGKTLLFDCGSSDVSKVGTYRLVPMLKQRGILLLDIVSVSHMDSDHMNGIKELLEEMSIYKGEIEFRKNYKGAIGIKTIVLPKVIELSEEYVALVRLAKEKKVEIVYMEAGETLYQADGILIECLSPSNAKKSENDTSLVYLLQMKDIVVWMMGDAGVEVEQEMIERIGKKTLEQLKDKWCVLKVGHHGSKTSSSEEFVKMVEPEVAIISCGYQNSYGHPHKEILERLEMVGSDVMSTAKFGAITIKIGKK